MRNVAETKLLDFNLNKSCFVIFTNNRRRSELMKMCSTQPLLLCDQPMKQESSIKYLGDYLCESGLAESVFFTVNKRKGLVNRAVFDIKILRNDCRANLTGGIVSGLSIWEMAIIPMLLYNAETWQGITRKTIDLLEKLQLNFLRTLLGVGTGCPIVMLYAETGTLLMEFRILQKKLIFLHHLSHLPVSALAKEVFDIQTAQGLPGIWDDCKEFLARYEIHDIVQLCKLQFKRLEKEKIKEMNRTKLIELSRKKQYKKVDLADLAINDFDLKPYFRNLSIPDSKLKFKITCHMVPGVKMNFQSDKGFAKKLWVCEACKSPGKLGLLDSQEHLLVCSAYERFRLGKDFDKDEDLVEYVKCVLQERVQNT